jgi:hypothetical protein
MTSNPRNGYKALKKREPIPDGPYFFFAYSELIPVVGLVLRGRFSGSYPLAAEFDTEALASSSNPAHRAMKDHLHHCSGLFNTARGYLVDFDQIYVKDIYEDGLDNWE